MMTSMPAGGTRTANCIFDFVECRARGTFPAERLPSLCGCMWCAMIHFVCSAFPGDSRAGIAHGPKLPQAENRLLTEVFSA